MNNYVNIGDEYIGTSNLLKRFLRDWDVDLQAKFQNHVEDILEIGKHMQI